ncbi:10143_t:CDS:2, partial [Cetraspora pellucida]
KNREAKQIKQCQDCAYKQEELIEVLSGFLEPYKDFKDSKPCEQIFNINIVIFLNTFLDYIETTDENKAEYILDEKTLVNDNSDRKTSSSSHIPDEEILSNLNTLDEEISSCSNLLNKTLNNKIS